MEFRNNSFFMNAATPNTTVSSPIPAFMNASRTVILKSLTNSGVTLTRVSMLAARNTDPTKIANAIIQFEKKTEEKYSSVFSVSPSW